MKKTVAGIVLVGIAIGLVQFTGCDGPEPDPCKELEPMSGRFTMGERITNYGGVDTVIVSDTVITENFVVFRADTTYESYEWKIGDDQRTFTTREVSLRFMQPESSVQIRLIAKWKPNQTCFPHDDGVDTVYKYLTVVDKYANPILGTYRGSLANNPSDIFDVTVSRENYFASGCNCMADPEYCGCYYTIRNINKGCDPFLDGVLGLNISAGYKKLNFTWDKTSCPYFGCRAPDGWVNIDETGKKATIQFSSLPPSTTCNLSDKKIKDIFHGNKVQ